MAGRRISRTPGLLDALSNQRSGGNSSERTQRSETGKRKQFEAGKKIESCGKKSANAANNPLWKGQIKMLRATRQIRGDKLGATDGEIGHIKDFYFDDVNWVVRYVVADTGSWLPGRLVLVSPHSIERLYQGGKTLLVNLTREQIEKSPPIDAHKPVSRQYEEEFYRYYGWPYYWEGSAVWGMSGFPILTERSEPFHGEQRRNSPPESQKTADSHLRSVETIIGYKVEPGAASVGYVEDFLLDDQSWSLRHVVVNLGSWRSNRKVLISPTEIQRISWNESKVILKLTKAAVLDLPDLVPTSSDIPENPIPQ